MLGLWYKKHHGIRRYHGIPPVFLSDYQDLGLQAENGQFRVSVLRLAWAYTCSGEHSAEARTKSRVSLFHTTQVRKHMGTDSEIVKELSPPHTVHVKHSFKLADGTGAIHSHV